MNNKRYTDEEIHFIIENYEKMTIKDIAQKLGRTEDGIAFKAVKLGLTSGKPKEYTAEEINFIKVNIGTMTITGIARELGRSQSGLIKFIAKTKVSTLRKKKRVYLENIDKDVIPFFSKGANYTEIIERMKIGDSFSFPYSDRHIVSNRKYDFINQCKSEERKIPTFLMRKTEIDGGIQMARLWRLF